MKRARGQVPKKLSSTENLTSHDGTEPLAGFEVPDVSMFLPRSETVSPVKSLGAMIGPGMDAPRSMEGEPPGARARARGARVMSGQVPSDEPRGVHVNKEDPLRAVERRALHVMKMEPVAPVEPCVRVPEPLPVVALNPAFGSVDRPTEPIVARDTARTTTRAAMRAARNRKRQGAHAPGRRWGLVPVAGAVGIVAAGLGGGAAYAFFSGGPGSGDASTGAPITIKTVATTGTADLLPGGSGAVYFTLHNPNPYGATFDQVASGATVVSDNTQLCPSSNVSIAQTLPYTMPSAVTVSPGGTSGSQPIANLVMLSSNAPTTCQGVTFTVTLTLSGQSS